MWRLFSFSAVALVIACSGSSTTPAIPAPTSALAITPRGAPPMIVVVARDGALTIAPPPATWAELATFVPRGRAIDRDAIYRLLRDQFGFDWSPTQTMQHVDEMIAIAKSARSAAIDVDAVTHASPPSAATKAATRSGGATGRVVDGANDLAKHQPAIVLVDPHAPPRALVAALEATNGLIGVVHDGAIGVLPLEFLPHAGTDSGTEPVPATADVQTYIDAITARIPAARRGNRVVGLAPE